jgi:hypothetical protein
MDDIVRQAMAKWPNVPDCFGWLGLDARGNWYMRDERSQAVGPFACGLAAAKGSRLEHDKLIAFIARNYASDVQGRWYFQNGPQRVYVELEAAPWVWRIGVQGSVFSHTGEQTNALQALVDEQGWLYLTTPLGLGLVHTQDMEGAANAIEQGRWPLHEVLRADLAQRYGYVLSPQQNIKKHTD